MPSYTGDDMSSNTNPYKSILGAQAAEIIRNNKPVPQRVEFDKYPKDQIDDAVTCRVDVTEQQSVFIRMHPNGTMYYIEDLLVYADDCNIIEQYDATSPDIQLSNEFVHKIEDLVRKGNYCIV